MSDTPISSFLKEYQNKSAARLHMPGHKGRGANGESFDITEISGADSLFEANGIIKESEKNAGEIFGTDTFYSTEGSSLSIRAMLYLTVLYAKSTGRKPLIAAARNAHKAFVSAAALLDFDIEWIYAKDSDYLSSRFTKEDIADYFERAKELPIAVYLTSPDYLGFISDIKGISEECKKHGVLLIVDNAHGAYLKFLPTSLHPIDLGADMCCDSAHKTLNALTGCAYLHLSKSAPTLFKSKAKDAMMLFASTSPSYLLLNSLDLLNPYLKGDFNTKLQSFVDKLQSFKSELDFAGYKTVGDEPMKITILAKEYGYLGGEISDYLATQGVFVEFSDPDYLVLMPSPENSDAELDIAKAALLSLPKKSRISDTPPKVYIPKRACSVREAILSPSEVLPIEECIGKTVASVTAACPPAIPIAVSGEIIDEETITRFCYYGTEKCSVIKK